MPPILLFSLAGPKVSHLRKQPYVLWQQNIAGTIPFHTVRESGRLFPSQDPRLSRAKLYWHFLIYIPP